jgi:hypothetical protein
MADMICHKVYELLMSILILLLRSYSKANTSKLEIPKIVSVKTLKKQENDFITRVVLANLLFVSRVQSRD